MLLCLNGLHVGLQAKAQPHSRRTTELTRTRLSKLRLRFAMRFCIHYGPMIFSDRSKA